MSANKLGYNIGLKLIRGAYMREELELAEKTGVESPVFDSIEETHDCYNDCLRMGIENSNENSLIFIASHNFDSINLTKRLID